MGFQMENVVNNLDHSKQTIEKCFIHKLGDENYSSLVFNYAKV